MLTPSVTEMPSPPVELHGSVAAVTSRASDLMNGADLVVDRGCTIR